MENDGKTYQQSNRQRVEFDEVAAQRQNTPRARAGAAGSAASSAEGEGRGSGRRRMVDAGTSTRSGSAGRTGSSSRLGSTGRAGSSGRTGATSRTGSASRSSRSDGQGRASRQTSRQSAASARTGSQRGRSSRRQQASAAHTMQTSNGAILRNRIIAVVVLVLLVVLLVSLVTCIARGLGGQNDDAPSATASSQAASASAEGTASGDASAASAASADAAAASSETAATADAAQSLDPNVSLAKQVGLRVSQRKVQEQGKMRIVPSGEGVEDQWVEGGRFATGDAELDQYIKEFCDNNTNAELSKAENAFNVYCYAVWSDYVERENNQAPLGADWDLIYAKQFMNEKGGNCFEQVAFAQYVLRYFGYYDAQAEPCFILRQSGDYGDHGLVFVTDLDGRKCLCDPAFGSNGWMLDADSYTMRLIDVGQDPSQFTIAKFEAVETAPWK